MPLCILDRMLNFFTPKLLNNRVLAKPGKSLLTFRNIIFEFTSNPGFVSSLVKIASFSEHEGAAYSIILK